MVQGQRLQQLNAKLRSTLPTKAQYSHQLPHHNDGVENAPVLIILAAPASAVSDTFIDIGSYLTAITLAAEGCGLAVEVQQQIASQHPACREVLPELCEDLMTVLGVTISCASDTPLPDDPDTRALKMISSRHCSFSLERSLPVPDRVVSDILDTSHARVAAQHGASSCAVSVLTVRDKTRDELSRLMLEEFDAGGDGKHEYEKGIKPNPGRLQKGTNMYAKELYTDFYGLDRSDKAGRRSKYRPNYEFAGAPVVLLLYLPKDANEGDFLTLGTFMYSTLLGMHSHGLGGKPQGSLAKYSNICRDVLGEAIPADATLICGIIMGWPTGGRDPREEPGFFPTRLPIEETTFWAE